MNSDEQQTSEPAKLWWESPWVMIAVVVVISLLGAVDQALN
tara:strand:- start:1220 stop:1342 length:123 start_codon:yes stop_codon:yes gene_type:complete